MRKFLLSLLLLAMPALASAQTVGPISITSTQCASIAADRQATVAAYVSGTWTGTLQPQGTIQGQAPFGVQITPAAGSTAQTTITGNGAYNAPVAGYSSFQLCGASVATGTAIVYLQVSPAQTATAVPSSATSIVTSGLMAEYRMTEGSGSTLTDFSGNGNNATFPGGGNNPTWVQGGLSFAGASQQAITLPAALNSALTIVMAYNFQLQAPFGNGLTCGTSCYVSMIAGSGGAQASISFISKFGATGFSDATLANRVHLSAWKISFLSTTTPAGMQGTHVVGLAMDTLDHFYIDGNEVAKYYLQGTEAGVQTGTFRLGGSATNTSWYTGQIYYAAFYNRVLTAAEVAQTSAAITAAVNARGVRLPFVGGGQTPSSTAQNDVVVFDGDSITLGFSGDWVNSVALQNSATVWDPAIAGSQLVTDLVPEIPTTDCNYFNVNANRNAAVLMAGTNDIVVASRTAAATHGALVQAARLLRGCGFKVFIGTQLNRGGFSLEPYNALIRQYWPTYADGLFDYASDPNLGCTGCSANTTYFNVDAIHPTAFGQTILQAIAQRGLNRFYGTPDFTSATTYVAAAPAATAVTATSESGNTATYTYGANPFPVGATVTSTGITPAGYNTTCQVLTSTATQITCLIPTSGLGVGSVFGTSSTPLMKDQDGFAILNFGAGNFTLESCVGYTGQRINFKNVNAAGSTLVPFSTELIDGAATLAIAANQTRILEAVLATPTTPVCSWKVIE